MHILKIIFTFLQLVLAVQIAQAQYQPEKIFHGYRYHKFFDDSTKEWKSFPLCGQYITADTTRFYTVKIGCERSISIGLGRYTYKNDTLNITPFNFIEEPPFLMEKKIKSKSAVQSIQFFTADFKPLTGMDSSWVVRLFKKRKSIVIDKTGDSEISFRRGKYEGMELMQMTKLFHVPIVLFVEPGFNYQVVLNVPKEAVEQFITGGWPVGGTGIVKDSIFTLNGDEDFFKIIKVKK